MIIMYFDPEASVLVSRQKPCAICPQLDSYHLHSFNLPVRPPCSTRVPYGTGPTLDPVNPRP